MEKEYFFNAEFPPQLHFQPSLSALQMPNGFHSPNFDKLMEQYSQFESALSSMITSPAASNSATDTFAIRELKGKLGTIFSTGEISQEFLRGASYIGGGDNSPNSSCYNTPTDSPPQLHLPVMSHFVKENLPNLGNPIPKNSALPALSADPGFAERAAKFSCFGSRSFHGRTSQIGLNNAEFQYRSSSLLMGNGKLPRVSSSPSLKEAGSPVGIQVNKNSVQTQMEMRSGNGSASASGRNFGNLSGSAANSNEASSVSEQNPSGENSLGTPKELNYRKRKGVSRGKAKEAALSQSANAKKEAEGDDNLNVKRSKMTGGGGSVKTEEETKIGAEEDQKQANNDQKTPEPPTEYIHVRARRGQATDSHSLAERVRREKISERMKLLQDLVPGCNKVTGKAVMLDEIINYVESLQRQVEFLSMKLATVNPRMDSRLLSKDIIFQPNGTFPNQMCQVNSSSASAYYGHQAQGQQIPQVHKSVEHATLCRNLGMHLDGFGEGLSQFPAFSEDDLQSIVQMGFCPKPDMSLEN